MKSVEKHIRRFNKMNGNTVRRDTLEKFLGNVPNVPQTKALRTKLSKAITAMKRRRLAYAELRFKALSYPTTNARPAKLAGVDAALLYGLEQIQDDSQLREKGLDGLSDTTYQVITDRILELMKDEGLIWRKPWNEDVDGSTDLAHNYTSKHRYRGVNFYLNYLVQYTYPYYFTFDQVTKLGGKVKTGEKGWPVVYFKKLYKELNSGKLVPDVKALDADGKVKDGYKEIPALFYYRVFNYDQTQGLKIKVKKPKARTQKEIIESAERIVDNMPSPPKITNGPDAWYQRATDTVQVPKLHQFKVDQEYYSVLFHELIHSTGHEKRVYRKREPSRRFGDKNYAFEELIAELGASYLCGESGVLYFTMKNSAAYIKGWASKLRQEMQADPKFFLRAAAEAQKAADFILDRKPGEDAKPPKASKPKPKPTRKPVRKPVTRKAAPAKQKPAKPVSLNGAVRADQIAALKFQEIPLDGEWKEEFARMFTDTQIMLWGRPGSGKTVKLLRFAQYLAEKGLNVLYVAKEELGRSSFTDKINTFRIGHPNLLFVKNLPNDLSQFHAVILDSVNKLGLDLQGYIDLVEANPNKVFMPIVQSTKDGDFRGGKDWEHEVDIAGEVVNRRLILTKNRLDPSFVEKAERLAIDEMVRQTARKHKIKQAVKQKLQPQPVEIVEP